MVPEGYGYKALKVNTTMRSGYDGQEVAVTYTYPAGTCPPAKWALGHMPGNPRVLISMDLVTDK
jgi:hypothetical protein